jgi:aryl-alcohol dehydrogenase-like predicted oxidoreductase
MDPDTPIEETMRVLKSLVEEGKIRYIGLSECTPDELRRAHAIHPISAIQMEWSLQTRDIEGTVLPVARELGVGIVPYSPLGRGFLADLATFDNLASTDFRRITPRFGDEANLNENKKQVQKFYEMAQAKGCTPAQLALAWVHAQGEDVFPIPGTKSVSRIEENAKAFSLLPLSAEELKEIENSVQAAIGERYPTSMMSSTFSHRL